MTTDNTPRRPGRPKTTGTTPMRQFRMDDFEFAITQAAAAAAGLSWSAWVRQTLLAAKRKRGARCP